MNVDSWSLLNAELNKIVAEALKDVGKKVADQMKGRIDRDVYAVGAPTRYERTGQLKKSVTTSDVEENNGESEIKIFHDKDQIIYNPAKFQHGSPPQLNGIPIRGSGDISEYIPEIIAFNKSGNLFKTGWWQHRNNYFLDTMADLKSQGLLSKWFKEALKKRGIMI